MKPIRKRLTYANVMSSIAVFLILGGATAIAAQKIGSHQLKANSVTTAKIKKNAVTTAKIKKNAITTAKIKNAAVTGEKINVETTPFGRVVAKPRGNTALALTESLQVYPLSPSSYTQAPEEDDSYLGEADVTFEPTCAPPRSAVGLIVLDSPNPLLPEIEQVVAIGETGDVTGGSVTKRMQIGPFYFFPSTRFEPGTATAHNLSLIVEDQCEAGSGAKVTSAGVDVIGTK